MAQKVLVILSTAEKEKALTGVLWATNALKYKWVEDVKLCFFGPFEALLAEDESVQASVAPLREYQVPVACKFVSDNQGVTDKLAQLGVQVEYVGQLVADYVNEGYVPMVF
ncbi:hypothetical protein [Alicyclobacillus mengziensis]|uniref:DsrE family protein n=1 Tax=Alicyclobacillus mengziensis TaxID=2931921 RepID=A0A9X7W1A8_9BACL|nr:hypothetical protein [Alicyclobacillus mengziensis]QSO48891.1 hypothetical protein JZ786_08065 [Alicyclobacillus mengziensis]